MTEGLSAIALVVLLAVIVGFYAIAVLFVAWLFSVAFRVKALLKVLGQMRDELRDFNLYNAERQS